MTCATASIPDRDGCDLSEARALVRDPAGFVGDPEIAQAAEDVLSVSDALAQPDALGASTNERLCRTG